VEELAEDEINIDIDEVTMTKNSFIYNIEHTTLRKCTAF